MKIDGRGMEMIILMDRSSVCEPPIQTHTLKWGLHLESFLLLSTEISLKSREELLERAVRSVKIVPFLLSGYTYCGSKSSGV